MSSHIIAEDRAETAGSPAGKDATAAANEAEVASAGVRRTEPPAARGAKTQPARNLHKSAEKPKTVKSEDRAVTVVGVVVVDVTVAVNVAEVVAVAGVWRTEPPVVRGARAIFTACNLHYEITASPYTFREGFSSRILRDAALSTLFPTTLPKPLAE